MPQNPPDPKLLSELRKMIETPKIWVSSSAMNWIDAGGRPPGYKFREPLLVGPMQPATLFVAAFYKQAMVEGAADKISFGLYYKGERILGVDEDGPSRHVNAVGVRRPLYGQKVDHPHLHTISDDAIYGYAEPLDNASLEMHWTDFLDRCNIAGAPKFERPALQLGLGL